jgi:hypothetical protein
MDQERKKNSLLTKTRLINVTGVNATKTTDFLLPLLGYTKMLYKPFLVNTYLGDYDRSGHDIHSLYIVLSNLKMTPQHSRLEDTVRTMAGFKEAYDILDGRMTIYIISFPTKYVKDYNHFLKGEYSQFSKAAQTATLKGMDKEKKYDLMAIYDRASWLREYWNEEINVPGQKPTSLLTEEEEVWPILNIDEEIFNKNHFIDT